jgi:voltage-gated potassium channel Kch
MAISVTGTIIGFITSLIQSQIASLKKGKSPIIEGNHTLILAWSSRVFPILQQLAVANSNVSNPLVVIFANKGRELMDDEISARVGDLGKTRVVTRSGDTTNPRELERANVGAAKSIIILDADESGDANVVATVLAVRAVTGNSNVAIVAEVDDPNHALTLAHATKGQVRAVRSNDVIARVTAQASRQPGLASVVLDMLDFEGDEIYFGNASELVGRTYGDAVTAFNRTAIIGIQTSDGVVGLNLAAATIINTGDKVIAIAANDDQLVFTGFRDDLVATSAPRGVGESPRHAEHILAISWSNMGRAVLSELAKFLSEGSTMHIVSDPRFVDQSTFENLKFGHVAVTHSATSGNIHELIKVASAKKYDEIIILGYREAINEAEADADATTMLTMLQMNQLFAEEGNGVEETRLVAEILDSHKAELARVATADDLVVSDNLAALMITQISKNPALAPVFEDLFDAQGASLNVKPIELYTSASQITFAELAASARSRGESVTGYRTAKHAKGDPASGVVLNADKSTVYQPADGDGLVVIGPLE